MHKINSLLLSNGYTQIPLLVNGAGHLTCIVKLNGIPALMTVDTGATATCIDRLSSSKFNLDQRESRELASGLGVYGEATEKARIAEFRIGDLVLYNLAVTILDLDHINHAYGEQNIPTIDGVLGADLFIERAAVIDFGGKLLFLKRAPIGR